MGKGWWCTKKKHKTVRKEEKNEKRGRPEQEKSRRIFAVP
jgi:hypothetical protein